MQWAYSFGFKSRKFINIYNKIIHIKFNDTHPEYFIRHECDVIRMEIFDIRVCDFINGLESCYDQILQPRSVPIDTLY